MQWFIVEAANRPGEFARHAEEIAQRGINLANVACLGLGDRGGAAFYATDEAGAARAPSATPGSPSARSSAVTAQLDDKPGTVADAARRLGDAGVNIELLGADGNGREEGHRRHSASTSRTRPEGHWVTWSPPRPLVQPLQAEAFIANA